MAFRPSAVREARGTQFFYPRFKVVDFALFFVIVPSKDCHISCKSSSFELGRTDLPFPKLDVYIQSLLETGNEVDLEDLIDGMNLTEAWGEDNLDLDGTTDIEWARWKNEIVKKGGVHVQLFWNTEPRSKREIWQEKASADSKRRRQGWKYKENWETRFWKHGQKDPRLREGSF